METDGRNNDGAVPERGLLTGEAFNWPGQPVQDGDITLVRRGSILSPPVNIETRQRRRRRTVLTGKPQTHGPGVCWPCSPLLFFFIVFIIIASFSLLHTFRKSRSNGFHCFRSFAFFSIPGINEPIRVGCSAQ